MHNSARQPQYPQRQNTRKQRILELLDPEDTRPSCAFAIERL